MDKINLYHVKYLPKELKPGILYVSLEFNVAGHLCPCGCGNKVITPLVPHEWEFTEIDGKASLDPSIGNWQLPCRSHYWIINGVIEWSYNWTDKQVKAGQKNEERKRNKYYKDLYRSNRILSVISRFVNWLFNKSER